MKISALRFEAIQRLLPTETGRRLSLQKSLETALENSRTSKEFFFKASKIKGMPNKDRIALKKAVKEIGEEAEKVQAQAQKETLKKQTEAEAKVAKKEAAKQADIERKVDEKKAKWDWAKSQAKKKKLSEQANRVQDAAEIPIGGSEDIQKAEVKKQFKKKLDPDRDIKNMTKEDIAEQERLDAEALKDEANRVFAKGGTELAGGAIAGIEIDEEGNVSLDPAKFVMGALGVASIKGLAKSYKSSPKAQAKIEKALKDLASDSTRVAGEMLEKINKQIGLNIEPRIIADTGPVSKAPFYSQLEKTIKDLPQDKFIKQQLLSTNKKGQKSGLLKDIKADEMKWSGIEEFLNGLPDNAKIPKSELLKKLDKPQLKKTILKTGIDDVEPIEVSLDQVTKEHYGFNDWVMEDATRAYDYENVPGQKIVETKDGKFYALIDGQIDEHHSLDDAIDRMEEANAGMTWEGKGEGYTKYEDYKTEKINGKNYREELSRLPKDFTESKELKKVNKRTDEVNVRMNEILDMPREANGDISHNVRSEWKKLYKEKDELTKERRTLRNSGTAGYTSGHWDESNILYHARKQDVKIDGKDTILIEEIQSDWHQQGRKGGYKNAEEADKFEESLRTKYKLSGLNIKQMGAVPQAPYSKTWHEKAMKDQIAEAVEKDYDMVAWVAGKEQAERYDLSKQVESIDVDFEGFEDGTRAVYVLMKNNSDDMLYVNKDGKILSGEHSDKMLDVVLGKEISKEIMGATSKKKIQGNDLKIGGEGMEGFYDNILPKATEKIVKKLGSKVEHSTLKNGQTVWSFKVTDKMKEVVKKQGQSFYALPVVGAVGISNTRNELSKKKEKQKSNKKMVNYLAS